MTPCTECNGTGLQDDAHLCAPCNGSGQLYGEPVQVDAADPLANTLPVTDTTMPEAPVVETPSGGSYIEDVAATQPDADKFGQTAVEQPYEGSKE